MAALVISMVVLAVLAQPRVACGQPYTLGVEASPAHGGTVTKSPDKPTYDHDEWVTIEAAPNAGWLFMGFSGLPSGVGSGAGSGDGSGDGATISFNISDDTYVIGYFAPGHLIPDPNLRQAIADILGKLPEDITLADLQGLTWLDASDRGISDLTGLQHCVSLSYLDLDSNPAGDFSALQSLTGLQHLYLSGCQFDDFSVLFTSVLSQLPNLSDLGLAATELTDGDIALLSTLADLERLNVGWNWQVYDFSPLSAMTNLKELLLDGCTSADPADLVSMVSGLSGLTTLYLRWLNLTDSDILPLASLTNLVSLSLNYNLITDLSPLSGLTALQNLALGSNRISDLQPLVDNPGLGAGDEVFLENNPLGVAALDVQIPALLGRGVQVSYDIPTPPSEVFLERGIDYEVPGTALDDAREYCIEVVGRGIREIEITTPWNETVTLSDILPAAWNGLDDINVSRGALELDVEGHGPAGEMSYFIGWGWLTDGQWDSLDSGVTMITVTYGPHASDVWSPVGGLNFAGLDQPTQEPLPTSPLRRNVEPGSLTVQWPLWLNPPAGGIVEINIEEEQPWWLQPVQGYWEEAELASGQTSWTPSPLPISEGVFELEICFANVDDSVVDGVDVERFAYTDNDVTFVVTDVADDHGNTPGPATPIATPASFSAALDYYGDIDFFSFTALAGQTYDILVSLSSEGLDDSTVWLYDTDGATLLAWDDDGGFDWGSRLLWTAPAAGTYYLAVDSYEFFEPVGGYSVEIILSDLTSDPPAAMFDHPSAIWLSGNNRVIAGSFPQVGAESGEGAVFHLLDLGASPTAIDPLLFNFEEFDATSQRNPTQDHPGDLTTLQSTKDDVTLTITRTGGQRFDVVQCTQPDFPDQWGGRAIDPGYAPDESDWFVASFSTPLVYVELQLTDFAEDEDTVFMEVYEGPNGTGSLLATVQEHWGAAESPAFASVGYTADPGQTFQSILFRGYSTSWANSMYADNLAVVTEAMYDLGQAGPLDPLELDTYFSARVDEVVLYAAGTRVCFGNDSNAWNWPWPWSEIVLLDLSGGDIDEVGRFPTQHSDVDCLAVDGDYLYVGTQSEDQTAAHLEVYRFNGPTDLVFVTQCDVPSPPGAQDDFDPDQITVSDSRLYMGQENGVLSIFDVTNRDLPPVLLGQHLQEAPFARWLPLAPDPADDILWVAGQWSLMALDVSDPADVQVVSTLPLGGMAGQMIVRDTVALVGCTGVGVRVVDISDPTQPAPLYTYHVNGATGSVALVGHHLYVPTGSWKTAIFALPSEFAAWCRTDPDWVYQNTPATLGRGGHKVRLTAAVLDFAGNDSHTVSVAKVPGSGPGEMTVDDDPGGDPLIKYVYGSLRSDGLAGTGPLILRVTVTGDVSGQQTIDLPLTVRPLGDIDGNGGAEPGDVQLLMNELNGLPNPAGMHENAFDIDANGGPEPGDVQIMMNILNGLPIP